MIKEIENMIAVIISSPELFHDGIDEEIVSLLVKIEKYIKEKK